MGGECFCIFFFVVSLLPLFLFEVVVKKYDAWNCGCHFVTMRQA